MPTLNDLGLAGFPRLITPTGREGTFTALHYPAGPAEYRLSCNYRNFTLT